MKRVSIVTPTTRRKSGAASSEDYNARKVIEQLDQDTTLVLQDIDKNISRANAIINDKLKPVIQDYGVESWKVWHNSGFWKKFFEQSANVVLNSFETPINEIQSSSNFLSEMEDEAIEEQPKTFTSLDTRRPDLKHLADEDTATWSTEQPPNRQMSASTPQRGQSYTSRFAAASKMARFPDNVSLDPPNSNATKLSPTRRHSKASPMRVQTIRQSLDALHRISISPRKQRTPMTTRNSAIQNLLNSSPTFPEPPVLQSEMGSEASRLPSQQTPGPSSDHEGYLRKFPNTPKYSSSRYSNSSANTPLAGDADDGDNNLEPPKLESETNHQSPAPLLDSESSEDQLPELNTIELKSSRKRSKTPSVERPSKRRVSNQRSSDRRDEEDNIFLDQSQKGVPNLNPGHNEDNSEHSRSISQIYAEGISKLKEGSASGEEVKEVEASTNLTQEGTREATETLTGDLGPFKERWKKLANFDV
ncbi:ASK1 [Candida metapsilosis]|uniref:DASH complex subunit ASK1 n=1 Tax=Candida metapsilosis TaxID=273372 RepID=A0A8H7ZBM9_9ASCO|nr:ASK1 [Candida metapsilosis]